MCFGLGKRAVSGRAEAYVIKHSCQVAFFTQLIVYCQSHTLFPKVSYLTNPLIIQIGMRETLMVISISPVGVPIYDKLQQCVEKCIIFEALHGTVKTIQRQ